MSLDIIVINYRTPNDLAEFLQSYWAYPAEQKSTLHVVNVMPGPADRDVAANDADLIYNIDERIDYGRAANIAGRNGTNDTIAVFNADTILTDGVLDGCADLLWSDPDYGIVGPRQVDESNRFTSAGIFGPPTRPAHRGWQQQDLGQYSEVEEVTMVMGSAMFLRRSLWDELAECPIYRAAAPDSVGPLMESHYYSDTWPCYHAHSHGKKNIYDGSHVMVHKWHRASTLGGYAEQTMAGFLDEYRRLCKAHGIEHE